MSRGKGHGAASAARRRAEAAVADLSRFRPYALELLALAIEAKLALQRGAAARDAFLAALQREADRLNVEERRLLEQFSGVEQ